MCMIYLENMELDGQRIPIKNFILIWKIMIRLKIIVGMTMGIMQQLYLMVIIVFSCRTLL